MNHSNNNAFKDKKTASQCYDNTCRVFKLDLHGCSIFDAERIVPIKVQECFQAGFRALLIVYGKSGTDLAVSVHKAIQMHVVKTHCHSLKCMGLGYGKYFRVENGNPEDVAVLVLLQHNAAPNRTNFSGFHTTYAGEIDGFTLNTLTNKCTLFFTETIVLPPQNRILPRKATGKSKRNAIVFPHQWLKGKKKK